MRVLVTAASRHGSTAELATEMGKTLRYAAVGEPMTADVRPVGKVTTVRGYHAVLLGSAVYAGHWLEEAVQFATEQSADLRQIPVWLFSSCPIDRPVDPAAVAARDLAAIFAATNGVEHRHFGGRIDRQRLGLAERAAARALRIGEGDFRDWAAVREWIAGIAGTLSAAAAVHAS